MKALLPSLVVLTLAGCGQALPVPDRPPPANPVPAPAPNDRQSHYTRLDTQSCRTLAENPDEAGYWLGRCPGHSGWSMDWSEGDLRQDLTLIAPDGRRTELDLTRLVAEGAFNSLGSTLEWRGPPASAPDSLILRMNVAVPTEPSRPDISRLAVIRLLPTPCLVAVIEPGPGQNELARQAADSGEGRCRTA